jgi:pimeloyl-ACP methyl ester carboxylesterase
LQRFAPVAGPQIAGRPALIQPKPASVIQPVRGAAGRIAAGVIPIVGQLGDAAARLTFGFQGDRRPNPANVNAPVALNGAAVNAINIGPLRGYRFDPAANPNPRPGDGKAVILFSGSGGTNQDEDPNNNSTGQLRSAAEFYVRQGATVFAVDYRGYGRSRNDYITEKSLAKDAMRVYDYVKNQQNPNGVNFTDADIIVHGYSLGGAIAAKVAKNVAKRGDTLGGLVLHSAMDSTYKAAKAGIGVPVLGQIGGFFASLSAGGFDTASRLNKIHAHDAAMPIHFMGGNQNQGDQLALSATNLDQVGNFANRTSYTAGAGHLDTASHFSRNQRDYLATLLSGGRNRNAANPQVVAAI